MHVALKGRAGKTKGKPVVRQTTLFNLPAPPPPEKVAKVKKAGKGKETATESKKAREAPPELKDSSPPLEDESPPTRSPSPEADLEDESPLTLDPEEAEDETQQASYTEEEREGSPDWNEVGDEDVEMGNAADPVSASS